MLEEGEFTVSYAPVAGIRSLRIIIEISSAEGLIILVLDIYNAIQNNITKPCRKSLSKFTLSISVLVQKKMAKKSIRLRKL